MSKWADYLISEASYDTNRQIYLAMRHEDTEKGITPGTPVDRMTISSDIKNGLRYITIYNGTNSCKKGQPIKTFLLDGSPYLRIDGNKVESDYLGDLPEVSISVKQIE